MVVQMNCGGFAGWATWGDDWCSLVQDSQHPRGSRRLSPMQSVSDRAGASCRCTTAGRGHLEGLDVRYSSDCQCILGVWRKVAFFERVPLEMYDTFIFTRSFNSSRYGTISKSCSYIRICYTEEVVTCYLDSRSYDFVCHRRDVTHMVEHRL